MACGLTRRWVKPLIACALRHGAGQHEHTAVLAISHCPLFQKSRQLSIAVGVGRVLLEGSCTGQRPIPAGHPLKDLPAVNSLQPCFWINGLRGVAVLFLGSFSQNIIRTARDAVTKGVHLIRIVGEPVRIKLRQRMLKLVQHRKLPLRQAGFILKQKQQVVTASDLVGVRNDLIRRLRFHLRKKHLVFLRHFFV